MSGNPRRILLGRIVSAHGIRGEVVIDSFTGAPEDIAAYGPLDTEDGRKLAIKLVRTTPKGGVIARVAGVADRNGAEALRGTELYTRREQLPDPAEGEFYYEDLAGLPAYNETGERIGDVVAVQNYGAGDLLEVRLEGQRATELIPFTDAFVPIVDVAARRVVVIVPVYGADVDGAAAEEEPS
jgi:16S rRNA processing protein RimM